MLGGLFLAFTAIGALWSPMIAPALLLSAAFAAAMLDGSAMCPSSGRRARMSELRWQAST